MDNEALQALLEALSLSPDNVPLRAHVVKEMLRSRRYDQVAEVADPLLGTSQQAVGLLALARAALVKGDAREAENHYRAAIAQDSSLIDESLEADLEASRTVRCTTSGTVEGNFEEPPVPSSVPKINFTDIGGMEQLKEQIRLNILYPMQKPEIYEAYGKKIGGGIMLYGPPGCGKTHLARATAGELGANFFTLSLNEVLNMYIGETEKNLAKLFETCRARTPSILFIDEVDALGAKRSSINNASTRWMVSHLLTEMDGIQSHNEKVLVLGATNAPWNVDSALRRPGRFDRVLFVPPPDARARAEILKLHS
ncbi:MAG: ATP-binding protein, partial [Candidatus Eremiobacteraeota bacterium]|nr:ATP-binding protein [Candidatus Eremiobacteraeota bacterium]